MGFSDAQALGVELSGWPQCFTRLPVMECKKWILFDIGGVLEVVDDDAWPQKFQRRWQARLGFDPEEYKERIDRAALPFIDLSPQTESAYWEGVGRALDMDQATVAEMRAEMWDQYCGILNVELMDFARGLHPNARVAILSNSVDGAREEEERRYAFSRVFAPIIYSHEIGVAKPEAAAYRSALQAMDAEPDQVFFIDDHSEAVAGAAAVGIRGTLHVGNAATIEKIEDFLGRP